MSISTEERTIQALFKAGWADETPVAWPNVHLEVTTLEEWIRFNIIRNGGFQAGFGDTVMFNRYPGIIDVQVFTKPGTGTKRALELADAVTDIFRGVQVDGVNFGVPAVDMQDVVDGWYQVNVSCKYYRDECEYRG